MSRALMVTVVLAATACGRSPARTDDRAPRDVVATAGRVADGRLTSAALGVDKAYRVWLPAAYDRDQRRYPVVYMLHGLGGNERDWTDAGDLAAAATTIGLDAIVVMPDGDSSFYADWARPVDRAECQRNPFSDDEGAPTYCVERAAYETYVVRDLIAHVDSTYRTIPRRDGRGIGGLSMGGFGALSLAMRHRDLFAAAASHSGVDALLYAGPHPYVAGKVELLRDPTQWGRGMEPLGGYIRGIFGPDIANWDAHDPAHLVTTLAPGELALYLDCGTEDGLALHDGAQYVHDLLIARGVSHDWYLGPGRHDFDFWRQRIDDSLAFFARSLTKPH
jgi:S-formylglutathione hydrolase FrmB